MLLWYYLSMPAGEKKPAIIFGMDGVLYTENTEIVKGRLKPLPGAVEFVRRCRELGFKTALATSTDYVKMMASLKEIGFVPEDENE